MGEHKHRANGHANGHRTPVLSKRIRLYTNLKMQNYADHGITLLMLGDKEAEVGCQLTPQEARLLASKLMEHATGLEQEMPRVIIPGMTLPGEVKP